MYHKEKGVAEAACEGAVVFFKHGKALIRNVGRIFGMGFLSLAIIGGGLFGIGYFVFTKFPQAFTNLANEIAELNVRHELDLPEFLTNPQTLIIAIAAILALILWSMIHSLLIRPFILVGVLRNFMDAGLKENITEEDMEELSKKSPKFAKLRKRTI
jgi:MFS superfamily sulfate permease-like transporter